MDYHKTSDMLALGLLMLLAGAVLRMLPAILRYTDYAYNQYTFAVDGSLIFIIGWFFTLFVLIRWVYRIVFGPVRDKCKKLDDLEEHKQDKANE